MTKHLTWVAVKWLNLETINHSLRSCTVRVELLQSAERKMSVPTERFYLQLREFIVLADMASIHSLALEF